MFAIRFLFLFITSRPALL